MEETEDTAPCPDQRCDAVAALLATAALGGDLSGEEQARMLGYLTTCAACRQRLDAFAGVAQWLPLSVPEATPSPGLRAQILASATTGRAPRQAARRFRTPWRRVLTLGLAAAALVLALLGGQQVRQSQLQLVQQQQQTARNRGIVVAAFGNEDALEARFTPGVGAPAASGRVLVSPGEPAVLVYAKKLPTLAAGRVYQVWLQGDGNAIAVGTFRPDVNDRAWAILQPPVALPQPQTIFITEEPTPGSTQPSGTEMLRAGFP